MAFTPIGGKTEAEIQAERKRNMEGDPALAAGAQGITGFQDLQQAGQGQRAVNTGLSKEQEASFLLGRQALDRVQNPFGSSDPTVMGEIEKGIRGIDATAQGARQGVQDFFDERTGTFMSREKAAALGLAGARDTQGEALSFLESLRGGEGIDQSRRGSDIAEQALGQSGLGLSPELQGIVDQERALGLERARGDVMRGFGDEESRMQGLLAARGLGGSSAATRGTANLQGEKLRQLDQARLAGEQQSLQREAQLRGMGLQERGQTIQGGFGLAQSALQPGQFQAGLGQAALSGGLQQQGLEQGALSDLANRIQGVSPLAAAQADIGLQGIPLALKQRFQQGQSDDALKALQIAMGTPSQPSGPGFGEILGGTLGSLVGAGGQIGAGYAGRK